MSKGPKIIKAEAPSSPAAAPPPQAPAEGFVVGGDTRRRRRGDIINGRRSLVIPLAAVNTGDATTGVNAGTGP